MKQTRLLFIDRDGTLIQDRRESAGRLSPDKDFRRHRQ